MPFVNGFNIVNGQIQVTAANPNPAAYRAAMKYDAIGNLYVSTAAPTGFVYNAPYRFAADGALYVAVDAVPQIYQAGLPFTNAGQLCLSTAPGTGYVNGWPISGGGIAVATDALPSFWAPLTTSLFPNVGPYPTFTRTTVASLYDFEGKVRYNLANEVRFRGTRRVQNLCGNSEFIIPTTGGTTPPVVGQAPYGGKTGVSFTTFPAGVASKADSYSTTYGDNYWYQVYPTTPYAISLYVALSRPLTGNESIVVGMEGQVNFNAPIVVLTANNQPGVNLVRMSSPTPLFSPAAGSGATAPTFYPGSMLLSPITLYTFGIQFEDVSGQINQAPANYVRRYYYEAGPWYGAGVNGVQYFNTTNGNSVVNNVVVEAAGVPISTFHGYFNEPADTNKMLRSSGLSAWTKTNCTVAANAIAAPDGNPSFTFTDNATSGVHKFLEGTALVSVVGAYNNWSIFAKAGTLTWIQLAIDDNGTVWYANFNLQTGTLGSHNGYTANIDPIGDGWYRCYLVKHGTVGTATAFPQICGLPSNVAAPLPTYVGTGQTAHFWGPQFASGPLYPYTYIPTTTVAVTRNAESLAYTYLVDGITGTSYAETYPVLANSQRDLIFNAGNGKTIQYYVNGVANYPDGITTVNVYPIGAPNKSASAWGALTCSIDLNGGPVASGAYVNGTNVAGLYLGTGSGGSFTGMFRNVKIFPTKFTDAQLQAVTA